MTIAGRVHLFPSRTQQLSSLALMILGGRPPGKAGRCRFYKRDQFLLVSFSVSVICKSTVNYRVGLNQNQALKANRKIVVLSAILIILISCLMIWTCCFFCILCRNVSLHYSRYHLKTTLRGRVFDTLMFVLNSFLVAAYKLLYQGYIIVNGIF